MFMDIQKAASRGSFFVLLKLYIPKIPIILIGEFKGVDLQEYTDNQCWNKDRCMGLPRCIEKGGQEE